MSISTMILIALGTMFVLGIIWNVHRDEAVNYWFHEYHSVRSYHANSLVTIKRNTEEIAMLKKMLKRSQNGEPICCEPRKIFETKDAEDGLEYYYKQVVDNPVILYDSSPAHYELYSKYAEAFCRGDSNASELYDKYLSAWADQYNRYRY